MKPPILLAIVFLVLFKNSALSQVNPWHLAISAQFQNEDIFVGPSLSTASGKNFDFGMHMCIGIKKASTQRTFLQPAVFVNYNLFKKKKICISVYAQFETMRLRTQQFSQYINYFRVTFGPHFSFGKNYGFYFQPLFGVGYINDNYSRINDIYRANAIKVGLYF